MAMPFGIAPVIRPRGEEKGVTLAGIGDRVPSGP